MTEGLFKDLAEVLYAGNYDEMLLHMKQRLYIDGDPTKGYSKNLPKGMAERLEADIAVVERLKGMNKT